MVDLVDILVERSPVHGAVGPVMPGILEHEEDCDLVCHHPPRWERYAGFQAAVLCQWVKEPDLREFDGEVREEDEHGAVPLLFRRGNLLLLQVSASWARKSHEDWQRTFWILYLFNAGIWSMMIHGRLLPKYTVSCMTKLMIPVARTSLPIYAYQAAHSFSK